MVVRSTSAFIVTLPREPVCFLSGRAAWRDQPTTESDRGSNGALTGEKLAQRAGKLARRFRRQVVTGFSNDSALIRAAEEPRMLLRLPRRPDAGGFAMECAGGKRDLLL